MAISILLLFIYLAIHLILLLVIQPQLPPTHHQTRLEFGLPEQFDTPRVCQVTQRSIMIGWFAGNPLTFGAASTTFQIQVSGGGMVSASVLWFLCNCIVVWIFVSSLEYINTFTFKQPYNLVIHSDCFI